MPFGIDSADSVVTDIVARNGVVTGRAEGDAIPPIVADIAVGNCVAVRREEVEAEAVVADIVAGNAIAAG